ncbi:MAG: DUF2188 domain-containing protein [Litorilinea sp.]
MDWKEKISPENIPAEMVSLSSELRHKAIEIANELLDEGFKLPIAVNLAAAKVSKWAGIGNPIPTQHVVPHPDGWAVMRLDASKPTLVTDVKQEAITRAREIAKNQKTVLVIHTQDGAEQTRHDYRDES